MKGSERVNTAGSLMVSYRHKKFNIRNILTVTSNVSNDSPYGQFSEYARLNPYWSPYDENGLLSQNIALQFIDDKDKETSDEFVANPLYNASLNTLLRQEYIDVTNNAYIEWMIKPGLKATITSLPGVTMLPTCTALPMPKAAWAAKILNRMPSHFQFLPRPFLM